MNVETVLAGLQAGELTFDFNAFALLRERDFAFHLVLAEAFDHGDRHRNLRRFHRVLRAIFGVAGLRIGGVVGNADDDDCQAGDKKPSKFGYASDFSFEKAVGRKQKLHVRAAILVLSPGVG